MSKQSPSETSFREFVKHERKRAGWSQAELSNRLRNRGFDHVVASTVAKIEAGTRDVRIDEAAGLADLFGTSLDAMMGRNLSQERSNLVMASHELTVVARRSAVEAERLFEAIDNAVPAVQYCLGITPSDSGSELVGLAESAKSALTAAVETLNAVAASRIPAAVTATRKVSRRP